MDIGIIGAGLIGSILARWLSKLSHKAFIANSRSPASLADLLAEIVAETVTVREAAGSSSLVHPYMRLISTKSASVRLFLKKGRGRK